MDTNKFAGMTAGIVVMLLLASAVLIPTIDGARMTTTTISNEGAGWAKFAYYEDSEDYSVALSSDGTTLTMGAQSGTADDMIVWASDSAAVIHDGGSFTLLYGNGDSSVAADLGSSATIASVSGALTITDSSSTEVYTSEAVEWTYTPNAGGAFGFFTDSGATIKNFPVSTAGAFAGVTAYNAMNSINYATMAPTYSVTDGVFTSGPWTVPDLGAKVVKEIEEKDTIKEIEEKDTIKAVPTPTYTDGDWGFNIVNGIAVIVSYSGAAGALSIPATVSNGGTSYSVVQVGIGQSGSPVFDNTAITGSTITIPDSVIHIASYAFDGCSGFTGSLTIPDSVEYIQPYAFHGCSGFTGSLTIPDSVVEISNYAFQNCSGFTGPLVIPDSITTLNNHAFDGCSGFTGPLVIPDSVTLILGSAFEDCSGFTGPLVIPDSVTSIRGSAFEGCSGFTGPLVIPESVTSIYTDAFRSCSGFTGIVILGSPTIGTSSFAGMGVDVLNLGNTSISPGQYGLAADAVIDDKVYSLGYIAPVSFSETTAREGAIYDLMGVIPLLIIASILLAVTSMIIVRRE